MTQYNTLRPYKFDRLLCVNVEKSWYECDLFAEKKKRCGLNLFAPKDDPKSSHGLAL